jgi:hypothetical protein
MSFSDKKEPYYSQRVTIRDVTEPVRCIGLKKLTVEVTYGNMEDKVTVASDDVLKVTDRTPIHKKVWDLYQKVKQEGASKGHKFVGDNDNE